jgi:dTDP-4-amino-4,6-dideoxygalactose transaminase
MFVLMIPLVDLKAQYFSIKSEIDAAVSSVLERGEYILGSEVRNFEQEFAAYCGSTGSVAVNSGTSALHLALLAAGIGPGDEVITVSMTFVATVSAITYTGASPVFVDIDSRTSNMDPAKINAAITKRTKAIVPVHLHGRVADMDPILALARRHGLIVIEDAAQAHGAEYRSRRAGTFGDIGCFSFYASKNLGAAGEGGATVSNNPEFLERMCMLRDWGAKRKNEHVIRGYNYRMENLQGAILRVKLRYLDDWIERRQALAARYDSRFDAMGVLRPPCTAQHDRHGYHIYAIRLPERDAVRQQMIDADIGVSIHYPVPVHLQPAFADLGCRRGDLPVTEVLARETLSLPLFPEMTEDQLEIVCEAVRRICVSATTE